MAVLMVNERTNNLMASVKSRRPNAWDVMPLVPIRKNPKSQYSTLKIMVPMAMAPI